MTNALDMAPWEAIKWFQTPTQTGFSPGGGTVQITVADPMRVIIIIGQFVSNGTVSVGLINPVDATHGILIPTTSGPFVISQAEFGPLPSLDWFAHGSISDTLTVIEVKLRDWPRTRAGQRELNRAIATTTRFGRNRDERWPVPDR